MRVSLLSSYTAAVTGAVLSVLLSEKSLLWANLGEGRWGEGMDIGRAGGGVKRGDLVDFDFVSLKGSGG
jgi:hypothetical protein